MSGPKHLASELVEDVKTAIFGKTGTVGTLGPDRMERFLAELRSCNERVMVELFTWGQCFGLWTVARTVFEGVELWYSEDEGHAYLKWRDRFYDIRGKRMLVPKDVKRVSYNRHTWKHKVKDKRVLCTINGKFHELTQLNPEDITKGVVVGIPTADLIPEIGVE